jgi:hypothetical protein
MAVHNRRADYSCADCAQYDLQWVWMDTPISRDVYNTACALWQIAGDPVPVIAYLQAELEGRRDTLIRAWPENFRQWQQERTIKLREAKRWDKG